MDSAAEWAAGVAAALGALRDLDRWEFPAPWWDLVGETLDQLAGAYADGDTEELWAAAADLLPVGPVRATRLGSTVPIGIPGPVLERRDVLVHTLSTPRPREQVRRSGSTPPGPRSG